MPQFAIVTPMRTRPLGEFASIDEVKKLRFIKDNPSFEQYIQELPAVTKEPKRYTRWRVIFMYESLDWMGSYSKEEAKKMFKDLGAYSTAKLILVPKYAYHTEDGPII